MNGSTIGLDDDLVVYRKKIDNRCYIVAPDGKQFTSKRKAQQYFEEMSGNENRKTQGLKSPHSATVADIGVGDNVFHIEHGEGKVVSRFGSFVICAFAGDKQTPVKAQDLSKEGKDVKSGGSDSSESGDAIEKNAEQPSKLEAAGQGVRESSTEGFISDIADVTGRPDNAKVPGISLGLGNDWTVYAYAAKDNDKNDTHYFIVAPDGKQFKDKAAALCYFEKLEGVSEKEKNSTEESKKNVDEKDVEEKDVEEKDIEEKVQGGMDLSGLTPVTPTRGSIANLMEKSKSANTKERDGVDFSALTPTTPMTPAATPTKGKAANPGKEPKSANPKERGRVNFTTPLGQKSGSSNITKGSPSASSRGSASSSNKSAVSLFSVTQVASWKSSTKVAGTSIGLSDEWAVYRVASTYFVTAPDGTQFKSKSKALKYNEEINKNVQVAEKKGSPPAKSSKASSQGTEGSVESLDLLS